jgi:CubicO group peptidase (beta-lactamase class C family)
VVQNGQPLLVKGYGVRDIGGDAPVDADTVFQLASNTKPMTAFTLGTLVDEGVIGWDTLVSDVLPELQLWDPYPTRYATPRDLFAHRTGFAAFFGDLLGATGFDRAEVLRRLRYVSPGSSFREVAAYSNLGYFIAGEVIARLTGAPWEEAMYARLMEPAGMGRSGPSLADLPADGNASANHGVVDGEVQVVPPDQHGETGAAGSAISTANDLARWMMMLLGQGSIDGAQLMQPETVRELFVPSMVSALSFSEAPPITETSGFSYGLGWGTFHHEGYEILEKGGALAGIRTVVCMIPALNAGVAVTANLNLTLFPEAVRAFVLEQFLGTGSPGDQEGILALRAVVDQIIAPVPLPENPEPPTVPLDAFAGTYEHELWGQFEVIAEGGVLRIEAGPAAKPAALHHFGRDTFLLDWGDVTSVPDPTTFVIGPDGIAFAFENESLGHFDRVEGD